MAEDRIFDLMKILKERQDKFVYYIAGLNVGALGYTFSKTYHIKPNDFSYIFLVVAFFCWLLSIFSSFIWIIFQFKTMNSNLIAYDYSQGFYNKNQISEIQAKNEIKKIVEEIQKDSKKIKKVFTLMVMLFLLGIISFITWRINYLIV